MYPTWALSCPACGSVDETDKGSYMACRSCGARYGYGVFVIPTEQVIRSAQEVEEFKRDHYPALLTGTLRDEHGWAPDDMFRLYLCLSRMKAAGRSTSASEILRLLDPPMDLGDSVHGLPVPCIDAPEY